MLEKAEAGDWHAYVDQFYGEKHKFKSPDDMNKLVTRYKERWGTQIVEVLSQARFAEPQYSANGNTATFEIEKGKFKLYKNEEGRWTYHH